MSNETNETKSSKAPTHIAYHVRESGNGKKFWTRVGAAWTNKDGGFTVLFECIPLDGKLVVQPADKKQD